MTPNCAASVVPAASATGVGRNRRSRSASGVASATMPAVAATESWNPIDQTSQGSSARSTSTAAARIEPVERGPPDQHADERERRHDARAHDGRLGAGEHHEERDGADPEREPRPPRQPSSAASARIGASTIATFSPHTTSRCPSPVAWKSR